MRFRVWIALVTLVGCWPSGGKDELAREAQKKEQGCSAHCQPGTCDNLGLATSTNDVPCSPNHTAKVGEKCSKHVNCAVGLRCTEDGWKGRCASDP